MHDDEPEKKTSGWWRTAGLISGVATVYWAAGQFGLMPPLLISGTVPACPPTGIALAALLILGYRVWPGIFLGALLLACRG
jgi:integral membrane sensor domain MASE1